MGYAEIMHIEIPIYRDNGLRNEFVFKVVSLLKRAAEAMERGNYEGILSNTRNAVTNHLTEFVLIKNKPQRIMLNTLKEELTQKATLQAVGVYVEVIKQLE